MTGGVPTALRHCQPSRAPPEAVFNTQQHRHSDSPMVRRAKGLPRLARGSIAACLGRQRTLSLPEQIQTVGLPGVARAVRWAAGRSGGALGLVGTPVPWHQSCHTAVSSLGGWVQCWRGSPIAAWGPHHIRWQARWQENWGRGRAGVSRAQARLNASSRLGACLWELSDPPSPSFARLEGSHRSAYQLPAPHPIPPWQLPNLCLVAFQAQDHTVCNPQPKVTHNQNQELGRYCNQTQEPTQPTCARSSSDSTPSLNARRPSSLK